MLKKVFKLKFKIIVVALLSLVLLQLVTAYIFGFITEKQMDSQFRHMTDSPLIQVKQRKYHRGIFSSDATTEITLNSQSLNKIMNVLPKSDSESLSVDTQTYSIKYTTHIEHGIFAGILNGYFIPTLAYSKTNIIYQDKVKAILNKFFNNQPPIMVDNLIYLDKSGRFQIHSPKFDYAEAVSGVKVTWGGLDVQIKYNEDFNKFKTVLSLPLFELIAPTKGSALIKNLVYKSDSNTSVNSIKVGDTKLTLDEVKVEWKDKIALGFKVGDMLHLFTGISSVEFLNGIDAIDPNSFDITTITYASNSQDENNFFGASAVAQFESLVTNGKPYGPMDLSLSVSHVDSKGFSQLIDQLAQISTEPDETDAKNQEKAKAELIKVLKANFTPILVAQPMIKLNRFSLNTPDGLIQISGSATTNNFTPADMNDQKKFMQKLALDVNLSLPKPILSYLFVLQMRYMLSAGNAQMDKQSSDALTKVVNILLDNQVSIWMKKGYIIQKNGVLSTHMYLKGGKLFLNDKASE